VQQNDFLIESLRLQVQERDLVIDRLKLKLKINTIGLWSVRIPIRNHVIVFGMTKDNWSTGWSISFLFNRWKVDAD
jgi:hypothetical protein